MPPITRDDLTPSAWARFRKAVDDYARVDRERLRWWRWFHGVFANAFGAIIIIDEASIILAWNAKAVEMLGWTAKEAVGQKLEMLIIPPRGRLPHLRAIETFLQTGIATVFDKERQVKAICKQGQEISISLKIFSMRTPGGVYEFGAVITHLMVPLSAIVTELEQRA